MDEAYTPEERQEILAKMHATSQVFYGMAVASGCHAFIEFTGLMNEFLQVCEEAEEAGRPWIHANGHNPEHLRFQPRHIEYLSEKLGCIYGKKLQLVA